MADIKPKKAAKAVKKFDFKLSEFEIEKLKGVSDCKVVFSPHSVTAIMGINGSGKSTILHALACCFKPIGVTSKPYNRFSDFFTPHTHSTWTDSKFTLTHEFSIFDNGQGATKIEKTTTDYAKNKRWTPIYERRPERESTYVGLQDLATLSDNRGAGRYAKYTSKKHPHENLQIIIKKLSYIIGREYTDIKLCETKYKDFLGLEYNGVVYSEHTMGAGEKRVLEILLELYAQSLKNGGLLLIDELDVLLHESAFCRLVDTLIEASQQNKNEVVFTTHRETIEKFRDKINITGVWNTGSKVITLPHVDPRIITQLTNKNKPLMTIMVEDELAATVVEKIIEKLSAHRYCEVLTFGAADNAFTVITGLILAKIDIKNHLCVLDGDVYINDDQKETQIKSFLTGHDKQVERESALKHIKQFNLPFNFINANDKGLPEYNHKRMLEAIPEMDNNEIIVASKSVVGLNDWHYLYSKMKDETSIKNITEKVIDLLSEKSEHWDNYTSEISNWIRDRLPVVAH
jgi:energy-coupling factor transporter ATP-binding protein EcfA2